ncbi:G-type lectin S-receptor-like serine/threonine-protein kinase At1g61440 [Hevea brasiliensis]|uniref:G-type lectin S-receptor-like serine/threonine-protein kinase At1g61440 n=1 Tax=Hevea brasiliensis TaxID=3981 RepID=UPI0025E5EDCD|nr:G-type lectin S-receptor-like serine/threonine-protein kinase At1g61440 [Hevea brasiliensis]
MVLQEQTVTSPGQIFEVGFFSPNNSQNQYVGIWNKHFSPRWVVWVANREKPVSNSLASLKSGSDGNLRLVDGKQETIWSTSITRPSSNSNVSLGLLSDNGVFSLKDNAWQSLCESRGISMIDEALAESFSSSEVTRCVNIGLLCVQDHAADRPTMHAIVSMLSGEGNLPTQNNLHLHLKAFCSAKFN